MRALLMIGVSLFLNITYAHALEIKRQDLVGAWVYVSTYSLFVDGRKENIFGTRPQGIFVIMDNGHYSHIIMRPDLPRVKSGRIRDSTLSEAEAIAEGVLAHYGTWSIDEAAGEFTVVVWKSSFANLDGMTQVRTVTKLDENNLSYVNQMSVAEHGARVIAVLQKLR